MFSRLIPLSFTLIAVFCTGSVLAKPYAQGDRVAPFHCRDQHGKPFSFEPAATDFLLVSHDMETARKANSVLHAMGKDYLEGKKAVYIANMHGMPAIGRMFAIPKMRRYTHRIVLVEDEELIARFPDHAGAVTVMKMNGGKVMSIKDWQPGEEPIDGTLK